MSFIFILKKIISQLIMPMSIGLLLLLIGLFYLYDNNTKKAKKYLSFGFLFVVIVSYVPFSNYLLQPLESKYQTIETIPANIKYIALLGGDRQNRAWEALRLYNLIPNSKIITTGYEGRGSIAEAIKTAKMLEESGVQKVDIIAYPNPQDTDDEAKQIKELVGTESFILVTSAYHMPRALEIFKSNGLNPIPSSTDFKIKDSDKALSAPDGYALHKTDVAWHEYIGLVWQKLKQLWQ